MYSKDTTTQKTKAKPKPQIKKQSSTEDLKLKPTRKPRTTKPKNTEAITTTPPKATQTIIKLNTRTNNLKDAADIFKMQKKNEQTAIRQELKEYAALTKGAAALNKSIAKLEAKQNKNKTN